MLLFKTCGFWRMKLISQDCRLMILKRYPPDRVNVATLPPGWGPTEILTAA